MSGKVLLKANEKPETPVIHVRNVAMLDRLANNGERIAVSPTPNRSSARTRNTARNGIGCNGSSRQRSNSFDYVSAEGSDIEMPGAGSESAGRATCGAAAAQSTKRMHRSRNKN